MKKLAFIGLMAISSAFLHAQYAREITYGANVGAMYSKMDNIAGAIIPEGYAGYTTKEKSQIGAMGGFFLNWAYPDEKISFQPELYYSLQNTDFEYSDVKGLRYNVKLKYQNLNFGFLFKYYFTDKLYVGAGPFLTLNLVKDNLEYSSNGAELSAQSGVYFEPDIIVQRTLKRSFEGKDYFHAGFAAGYEFDNGINLGFRYHLGLSDAWATQENGHRFRENSNKVNSFSLQIGYRFNFTGTNNF